MVGLYRNLLRLYPAEYFREYGAEMILVFSQAREDTREKKLATRLSFCFREVSGALIGGLRQRLFGRDWSAMRRFDMHPEFRFPRSTVFLMWVILAGVVIAIQKAKAVVAMNEGLRSQTVAFWHPLFWLLPLGVVLAIVGAVWGILFALGRTGVHRLANVQSSPEQW